LSNISEAETVFFDAIEAMPEGRDLLFTRHVAIKSMGSFFDRLAKKAGITLWVKPAQNLRLTASNRVVREFGVICESEWIGHTPEIAKTHYLRVQRSDYEIAANSIHEDSKKNIDIFNPHSGYRQEFVFPSNRRLRCNQEVIVYQKY
jgi:hypothetical protein